MEVNRDFLIRSDELVAKRQQAATVLQKRWREITLTKLAKKSVQPLPENCQVDQNKVIFGRAIEIKNRLSNEYYVFSHGTAGKIGFIHDLLSFQDAKNSRHKRFRVPGKAVPFKNYDDFRLSSYAGSHDNTINASILSCDGYLNNENCGDSAWYFFDRSISVVTTHYQIAQELITYAVATPAARAYLTNEINQAVANVPMKGRYYLIAVPKKTLENPQTNYAWRSHPLGIECKCEQTDGHFIHFLNQHQKGIVKTCNIFGDLYNPQYRLLVHNVDLDQDKKVFSFNPFNADERASYISTVVKLRRDIRLLRNLELIDEHTPKEQILSILLNIDLRKKDENYWQAVTQIIGKKSEIIAKHKEYLNAELPFTITFS